MISSEEDPLTDGELMARLAQGEVERLGTLYRRHGDAVLRLLHRMVMDDDAAEDLCQEVFLAANRGAHRYTDQGKLRHWLCRIASRKARAWRRKQWLRQRLLRRYADERRQLACTHHDAAIQRDTIERVVRAISQLPTGQRDVLLLHVGEGMTGDEIAQVLGISCGAARVRLHRARMAVHRALEDNPLPEENGENP